MKNKILSHIIKIIFLATALLLSVVLLLNISTIISVEKIKNGGAVKSGYFCAIVNSKSMEPTIDKYDFLIIKGNNTFNERDIATYISDKGTLITHRIITVLDSGYITKGDANNTTDRDTIQQQRLLGEVVFVIPKIGLILKVFSSQIGILFIVTVPTIILLLILLIGRIKEG